MIACEYAVRTCGIENDTIVIALENFRAWGTLPASTLAELDALAKQLDDRYLTLQERAGSDPSLKPEYLSAFSEARAVSALTFAARSDGLESAAEAVYEAASAVDDPKDLVNRVLSVLGDG